MNKFINKIDGGIVTNAPSTKVQWAAGRNIRFKPGACYKTQGKTYLATVPGGLPVREIFTFKGHDGIFRSIVCCDTKIFSYTNNFTVYTDITSVTAPSSGANDSWQFELIGGMPVLSNGVNQMWKWPNYASVLVPMSGPPTVCKAIANATNRLMAGNIVEGGGAYPGRVRWSDILKPENWPVDLKGRSGGKDLVAPFSGMDAVDTVQALDSGGESTIAYTERNVWIAENAEHPEIFRFSVYMAGKGLIAPRARTRTDGLRYAMGQDDFYPISKDLGPIGFNIRNSVFPNLNKSAIRTAFAFYKPSTREIFFCVPTGSNAAPDTAFIYQTETKSWSLCDCDYLCHSFAFDTSGYTWNTLPYGSWDAITDSRWDEMSRTGIIPYEVVGTASGQILKLDSGDNNVNTPITGYIETGDMDMGDPLINKILACVYPSCKPQTKNNALMIQVGTRKNLSQDIVWSNPVAFSIGVSNLAGFRKQGKFIRIRFYTDQLDSPWILDGYGYDFSRGSSR